MKVVAISGTYRKGRTIDTLIGKAVEGVKKIAPDAEVTTIQLIDKNIQYCKNCMACRKDDPEKSYIPCIIKDDMDEIYPLLDEADAYIFGTPVNIGDVTAVMKTFLERMVWVMAKPGDGIMVKGCPVPRNKKKKKAVIIVSSGLVPTTLRMFCDSATALIKTVCESSLNAEIVGNMYAGAIEKEGMEGFFDSAVKLGEKLN